MASPAQPESPFTLPCGQLVRCAARGSDLHEPSLRLAIVQVWGDKGMDIESILAGKGREVRTIMPDATVAEAVDRMRKEWIGALVVPEEGRESLASSRTAGS